MVHVSIEQVEVLLSQFEWKSRDSPTETRLTDGSQKLVIRDSRQFPLRRDTVRRMANNITYTMYAAYCQSHYVYNPYTYT